MKLLLSLLTVFFLSIPTSFAAADLFVSQDSIRLSNPDALQGEEVTIYTTVYNSGEEDLRGVLQVINKTTGRQFESDVPLAIIAGSSANLFTKWSNVPYGSHTLLVRVKPWDPALDNPKNNEITYDVFFDRDTDGDGLPDEKDPDDDNDTYEDSKDAFPLDPSEWADTDGDGIGNNADEDDDGDTLTDLYETENDLDPLNPDTDGDSYRDDVDEFPTDKEEWKDFDQDGIGDNADKDDDNDRIPDDQDEMPNDPTESRDTDGDGIGNNTDTDDDGDDLADGREKDAKTDPLNPDTDGDGTKDGHDAFPLDPSEDTDTDTDGLGNNADTDDDNDGIEDERDSFPLDSSEWADTDNDGIGNNADEDDDNDEVLDSDDAFPENPDESVDSDNDGIGDNSDTHPEHPGPEATITGPTEGEVNQEYTFDGTSSRARAGALTSMTWLVGGEEVASTSTFTTSFSEEGPYIIQLTVTDDTGESRTIMHRIVISPEPPILATVGLIALLLLFFVSAGGAGFLIWKRKYTPLSNSLTAESTDDI